MEGDEAAKAFQVIKDDREALFKKLKDRKGGKGGKFGMKKRAPKNKKITFDDDEPAEKKVKGKCSENHFRLQLVHIQPTNLHCSRTIKAVAFCLIFDSKYTFCTS